MSVVHYKCEIGYRIHGSSKRTCQVDKRWDGEEPICIPMSCGQPPALINGQVRGNDYRYGKHIEYQCFSGFLLKGEKNRTCLADGHWSGTMPECLQITCKPPHAIPNGEIKGTEYTVGSNIIYKCIQGHKLEGASKLTCQKDGTWDAKAPRCAPIDCGPPEDISHGFLNSSGFHYNEYVQYICFPGYEIHGSPTRQCLASGLWSGNAPSCLPCECPKPTVQNAKVIGDDFSCGHSIKIRCYDGFKLFGHSDLSCESIGKWSSGFPYCGKVSCGPPPIIPNAFINGSSSTLENAIKYTCLTGYVMQGKSDLVCTEEGKWSKPYPICQLLSCRPPPIIPNAVITGSAYTFGSVVEYRCEDGYIMDGDMVTKSCLEDGSWSTEEITCVPRKCKLQSDTVKIKADYDINKTVTVICQTGYTLSGPSTSTCMTDGNWLPPLTDDVCSPVSCGQPSAIGHGTVLGTRYSYKDTVLYQCDPGYEIHGPIERVCEANKSWSGVEPQCKRIFCNPPEPVENGLTQGTSYFFEDEIHYSCNQGFELHGPSHRICHVDKQWRPPPPTCVSVVCGPYPSVQNALSIPTGNAYKDNVIFICNNGYHLIGPNNITCLADGKWSQPMPQCKETRCEVPISLENGRIEYENATVGSTVMYHCNSGYSLEGEDHAKCTENGNWSQPVPLCKPNPCPVPFVIPDNAILTETEFYVGQKLSMNCRKGHRLVGQAIITCNADLTWTETSAKCEKNILWSTCSCAKCNGPWIVSSLWGHGDIFLLQRIHVRGIIQKRLFGKSDVDPTSVLQSCMQISMSEWWCL